MPSFWLLSPLAPIGPRGMLGRAGGRNLPVKLRSAAASVTRRFSAKARATNFDAAGKLLVESEPAPESAEVVVVGGGSLGCSALYHLARKGVTNTILIEANKLTAGQGRLR